MPSKEKRVRVERGLYRIGSYYHACATPRGARTPRWRALGQVGPMEARRLRDTFASDERPRPGAGGRRFLSKLQMGQLLAGAPDRDRVAIACAMFSGLRLSEVLGLV